MQDTPSVVAFSGHMTDAPSRPTPRFPEAHVPSVRQRIREALTRLRQPLLGVSSAARGADLLFIDELLALGGHATVVLPFPQSDFKQTSVGQGWDDLFERLLKSPQVHVPEPLLSERPADSARTDAAFAECNDRIIQIARELVKQHGVPDALFLAVYKQTQTDLLGGTKHAFDAWTSTGGRLELIDP
jgi:hypothetical protein